MDYRLFLGFIFFEGTHAHYSFPADTAIRDDYTPSVDYAELKADELLPKMDGMFARYQNAAHYVDQECGQVYEYLKNNALLDNTIVIVTGDHGEEFMENDRWGHNSSFSEQQIRAPMIVSHPDYAPAVIESRTSHMDIPAMLLQSLGVTNPLADYSLGQNIMQLADEPLTVVASWTDLGIVSEKGKLVIPFKSTTQHRHLATSPDDKPIALDQLTEALSAEILQVITKPRRFVFSDKSLL